MKNNHLFAFGFFLFILSSMFLVLGVIFTLYMPPLGLLVLAGLFTVMYFGASLMVRGKYGADEPEVRRCIACGREKLTRYLEFKECRAYLLLRKERSLEGHLCGECAEQTFKTFCINNLKFGWWSLPGLFRTPMMLIYNLVYYRRSRVLRDRFEATDQRGV